MSDSRTLLTYGLHAVEAAFRHAPEAILECWIRLGTVQPELEQLVARATALGVRAQRVGGEALERIAGAPGHQGVVIRRRPPRVWAFDEWLATHVIGAALPLVLVVDQLQDPQNLGAVLRLADATGVSGIILTKDRSAGITPAVAKVASGALDTVPLVFVTNLARTLEALKEAGVWLVGASGEASESLYMLDLNRPLAWIIGAEGAGLRRLTRESCDWLARIPLKGTVESLNLGTATAVCLFETLRQRGA